MKKQNLVSAIFVAVLAGCASQTVTEDSNPGLPGSDRDEFGCIPSAGYSWCARTNQCERPWELAEQEGIDDDPEVISEFCN